MASGCRGSSCWVVAAGLLGMGSAGG